MKGTYIRFPKNSIKQNALLSMMEWNDDIHMMIQKECVCWNCGSYAPRNEMHVVANREFVGDPRPVRFRKED